MSVLEVAQEGRVRVLTLNRPEVLNAFNNDLYDAVRDALRDAESDPGVAVVVLTGAGRAFTAGQDLGELANPPPYDGGEPHGFVPFIETVESFPKPLIAAVNGVGVGIGMTMLLHCDIVVISSAARLQVPFVRLGVVPEAGSSTLLAARIGWQEAAYRFFTAEFMSSADAVRTGLAWKEVAPEILMQEAMELAERIAAMPVPSLVATKRLMLASRAEASRAARDREGPVFASMVGAPANREALAAFAQKREPDFTNLPID